MNGPAAPRWSRREFARALLGGAAAAVPCASPFAARMAEADPRDERSWASVRDQFLIEEGLAPMNAANLCPAPAAVARAWERATREVDRDPSHDNRRQFDEVRERTRAAIAAFLRVEPGHVLITRNTSEGNNLVSSGLDLKAGDEVLVFADNHPSNLAAWKEKAGRFGYTVVEVERRVPHPGAEHYIEAFARKLTARTRVMAFTHLTNTLGDLFPARELCRLARERGVLTLVDGAQSFGLLDVDLSEILPDFYTASAHKWLCGPREAGVLYVSPQAAAAFRPSVISHHPGAVGLSRTHEALGQRNDAALVAFEAALRFHESIGRARVEARARELAQALMEGLGRIEGIALLTHPAPDRSAAVVTFRPAGLDPGALARALYERDRIAGAGRPEGLRLSPHLYNSHAEVERAVSAVRRYVRSGL